MDPFSILVLTLGSFAAYRYYTTSTPYKNAQKMKDNPNYRVIQDRVANIQDRRNRNEPILFNTSGAIYRNDGRDPSFKDKVYRDQYYLPDHTYEKKLLIDDQMLMGGVLGGQELLSNEAKRIVRNNEYRVSTFVF